MPHPSMTSPTQADPRCPEWCSGSQYPGLVDFLLYYGSPLSDSHAPAWPGPPVDHTLAMASPPITTSWPTPEVEWTTPGEWSSASSSPDSESWSYSTPPSEPEEVILPPPPPPPHSTRSFAPKMIRIFDSPASSQEEFPCTICGPSTLQAGSPPKSQCQHYVSCSECQSRLVRQLLRCGSCCRLLTGEYPGCGEECEKVSKSLSQVLQTTDCPRCGDKLAKDTCSRTCHRKKTESYKRCRRQVGKQVAAMVLHPDLCLSHYPGARPCCHYTRCELHNQITRGRSHRCSECREVSKSGLSPAGYVPY